MYNKDGYNIQARAASQNIKTQVDFFSHRPRHCSAQAIFRPKKVCIRTIGNISTMAMPKRTESIFNHL